MKSILIIKQILLVSTQEVYGDLCGEFCLLRVKQISIFVWNSVVDVTFELMFSCVIKIEAKVCARFRDSFDIWRPLGL